MILEALIANPDRERRQGDRLLKISHLRGGGCGAWMLHGDDACLAEACPGLMQDECGWYDVRYLDAPGAALVAVDEATAPAVVFAREEVECDVA